MNRLITTSAIIAMCMPLYADDFIDDDIYYNPSKEKSHGMRDNYIADFQNIDIDEYNRRGQYYLSPVDTVGERIGGEPDFTYTQQIQKYYNPTIVVDNADVLADVLENSYGNVEIMLDGGNIAFAPSHPSYYFGINPYLGWNSVWYDPWYGPLWYNWGYNPMWVGYWGPSWGWGPAWSWGLSWGCPSYTWCPSWSWTPNVNLSSGGHRRNAPSVGWASNTRPGKGSGERNYHNAHKGSASTNAPNNRAPYNDLSSSRGGNHRTATTSGRTKDESATTAGRNSARGTSAHSSNKSHRNTSAGTTQRNTHSAGNSYNSGGTHRSSGSSYGSSRGTGSRSTGGRGSSSSGGGRRR